MLGLSYEPEQCLTSACLFVCVAGSSDAVEAGNGDGNQEARVAIHAAAARGNRAGQGLSVPLHLRVPGVERSEQCCESSHAAPLWSRALQTVHPEAGQGPQPLVQVSLLPLRDHHLHVQATPFLDVPHFYMFILIVHTK